jgi:Raf kinase inhibitor-like YbhB/YbcL family protein
MSFLVERLMVPLLAAVVAVTGPITRWTLQSPAFKHTARIPSQYTCDGKDMSPPLQWGQPPAGTKRIAIVVQDPTVDSGSAVHWLLYDLPGSWTGVPAGVARSERLPSGARQGRNDFGSVGYRGPCPPAGKAHDYWFRAMPSMDPSSFRRDRAGGTSWRR